MRGPRFSSAPPACPRGSGYVAAEADRQVLQLALPALVADRAIERVIDEQELHGGALRADGARGLGEDLHALDHRGGAGRQGLGAFSTSTRHMRQLAAIDSFWW